MLTGGFGMSMDRLISAVLTCLLSLASLVALYEMTTIPTSTSNATDSLTSVQTIREFYVALDEFVATGDAGALSKVLAPGALANVPDEGAWGEDSGLMTYLLALRSTFPNLRHTVDDIDAGGEIAVARVHVWGTRGGSGSAGPSESAPAQEFFRVRDGRIIQHWTVAASDVLLHPLTAPAMTFDVFQPGHLAIAELEFLPAHDAAQPIDGPAIVIVQRGRLSLQSGDSTEVWDLATGADAVDELNGHVTVMPGRAISISESRVYVWNGDSEAAAALIATFVPDPRQELENIPGYRELPPPAVNDAWPWPMDRGRMTVNGAVIVHPIEFGDRSIPTGNWEFEVAWAVLGPDASLPLVTEGEWAIAQVIGDATNDIVEHQLTDGLSNALTDDGDDPVVALVIRVRAAT